MKFNSILKILWSLKLPLVMAFALSGQSYALVDAQTLSLKSYNIWPQVAAINFVFSENRASYCTGTLVASNAVLTSAHCIKNFEKTMESVSRDNFSKRDVVVFQTRTKQLIYQIKKAISLNPPVKNDPYSDIRVDLAVIILKEHVKEIQPMELATQEPEDQDDVALIGYGGDGAKRIVVQKRDQGFYQAESGDSGGAAVKIKNLGTVDEKGILFGVISSGPDARVFHEVLSKVGYDSTYVESVVKYRKEILDLL